MQYQIYSPHYSLHDETHSITIINNIVRILGVENIDKLLSNRYLAYSRGKL